MSNENSGLNLFGKNAPRVQVARSPIDFPDARTPLLTQRQREEADVAAPAGREARGQESRDARANVFQAGLQRMQPQGQGQDFATLAREVARDFSELQELQAQRRQGFLSAAARNRLNELADKFSAELAFPDLQPRAVIDRHVYVRAREQFPDLPHEALQGLVDAAMTELFPANTERPGDNG